MASVEEAREGIPNKAHAYLDDGGDSSSLNSNEDAQAGVKNIEAISQTWTKWSLVSAYVGSVSHHHLRKI